MDENQQELIFKLSMYEQQIRQLQQQLQAIEQAILEITSISQGLEELVGAEGKEILAPIGKGIFAKTKLLSEELTVDIGNRTFVKKSIPETKKMVEEQIKKLEEVRKEVEDNQSKIGEEMQKLMGEVQEKGDSKD